LRCLEGAEIDRYAAGTLDAPAADAATAHLTECKRCRAAVAEARGRLAEEDRAEKAMVRAHCPTCNARYGIPEERVKGRVLKIRCKACGGIIEVRGSSAPPPARSLLERGRKLWFLVIRRERIGPITEQEVRERFARGELKPRTYAWRQGFARWERLYNIGEFKDLATGGAQTGAQTAVVEPVAEPRGKRPVTRPLPELVTADDPERTERAKRSAAPGLGRALKQSTDELDFDSRRASPGFDLLAKTPVVDAVADAGAAIRTHYHPPPEITPELRPGFRTQEDVVEPPPRETGSATSQLTHVHFKEADPLADLGELPDAGEEGEAEESAASRTSVIPAKAMEEPEQRRPLAAGEFDRHLRGQRSEDSVLFSLSHLRKVAHTALPPRPAAGPVSTGMTGLFNIKPVAARPAPLLMPMEEPPRAPRGVAFTFGVLTLGAVLGAGALLGGLYLARPAFVRSLLGLGPTRTVRTVQTAQRPDAGAAVRVDVARLALAAAPEAGGAAPAKAATAQPDEKKPDEKKPGEKKPDEKKPDEKKAEVTEAKATAKATAKAERPPAKAKAKAKKRVKGISVVDPGAGDEDPPEKPDPKPEPKAKPEPEPSPPEPKADKKDKKKGSTTEELDRLIDAASEGKPAPKKAEPKEEKKPDEPKAALSREQVAAGMRRAASIVQECNDKFKQSGMVTVEVTIDGASGRIGRGKVVGGFAGTALGECVLTGVKRAALFPKFAGQITIQYPFLLK
jgi:hypothetical protein